MDDHGKPGPREPDRAPAAEQTTNAEGTPAMAQGVLRRNLKVIAGMERRALAARTLGERIGDAVARAVGSMWMVVVHLLWFGGWIAWNTGLVPGAHRFDPFPFGLLTMVVSLEAIFLSLFLLISQNRLTREADKRARLDLQINLLAEEETTKVLRLLDRIAAHLGVEIAGRDQDLEELETETDIEKIAAEVDREFPGT